MLNFHVVLAWLQYPTWSPAVQFLAITGNTLLLVCLKHKHLKVSLLHLSHPATPNEGEQVLESLCQNVVTQGTDIISFHCFNLRSGRLTRSYFFREEDISGNRVTNLGSEV